MLRPHQAALLAGLIPLLAANLAYLINVYWGEVASCNPYWSGCVSISRATRSGPGLDLFRSLMLASAVVMWLTWWQLSGWLNGLALAKPARIRVMFALGSIGAIFLALYVINLGVDGDFYRFMRRTGVFVYFGFTALAQLLLLNFLWPDRRTLCQGEFIRPLRWLMWLVGLTWALGVGFSIKRLVISDPTMLDRIESVVEWWFALLMSLVFVAISGLFRAYQRNASR